MTFSDNAFTGIELWLELHIRPGESSGSYTTLAPRQLIQPAPYANTLRPGARITAAFSDTLLTLDNEVDQGLYVEAQEDGIQVAAGDLLTASGVTGHVMKATPIVVQGAQIYPPGTIVGKAMAAFAGDMGVIKMLVMLQ